MPFTMDRKALGTLRQRMQSLLHDPAVPSKYSTDISTVMGYLDGVASEMRREAIFKAGAETEILQSGEILFEGHPLGSMERCTFYDGHESTHPKFKNPYRHERR
jgi:hypothetical protein